MGQDKTAMAAARKGLAPHVPDGRQACVVGLPGGFEAVLFDNTGHLSFWSSVDETHWKQDQTANYRYDPRDAKGQHVRVTATDIITGSANAIFIINGTFSGDGTGNAMVYAYGRHGWGPVVWDGAPESRSWGTLVVADKLPPESSDMQVAHYKVETEQGDLVTYDCDEGNRGGAQCGAHLIPSHWRWDGTDKAFHADES